MEQALKMPSLMIKGLICVYILDFVEFMQFVIGQNGLSFENAVHSQNVSTRAHFLRSASFERAKAKKKRELMIPNESFKKF